jgi:hypothetical protein
VPSKSQYGNNLERGGMRIIMIIIIMIIIIIIIRIEFLSRVVWAISIKLPLPLCAGFNSRRE